MLYADEGEGSCSDCWISIWKGDASAGFRVEGEEGVMDGG